MLYDLAYTCLIINGEGGTSPAQTREYTYGIEKCWKIKMNKMLKYRCRLMEVITNTWVIRYKTSPPSPPHYFLLAVTLERILGQPTRQTF